METRVKRRWTPFLIVGAGLAIAFVAIARLPESYVAQMARNRPFFESRAEADWAYRLLTVVAFAQAIYGGFVLLQIDRVKRSRERESAVAAMPRSDLLALVTRAAAVLVALTFVYGVATFWVTGQRGGFWLFAALSVAQIAWYFRQVNVIARYLDFQPEPRPAREPAPWNQAPADYCPPLARGLRPLRPVHPPRG